MNTWCQNPLAGATFWILFIRGLSYFNLSIYRPPHSSFSSKVRQTEGRVCFFIYISNVAFFPPSKIRLCSSLHPPFDWPATFLSIKWYEEDGLANENSRLPRDIKSTCASRRLASEWSREWERSLTWISYPAEKPFDRVLLNTPTRSYQDRRRSHGMAWQKKKHAKLPNNANS